MTGSIRRRGKNSWELTIDLGWGPDGKRLRKFVSVKGTKTQAQQKLREILSSLDKGIPPDSSKATLGEFLEQWMRDYVATNTAPSTRDGYHFIVRCHLIPKLGRIALTKLQPANLQEYYAEALLNGRSDGKGGLSARTVQHHHRVLSKALSHAVKWGLIARNVATAVDPPKPSRAEISFLSPDDADRLLDMAEGTQYYALIFTALYSGLRRGELLGLRWCDVNLLMSTISVNQSLQRLSGGAFSVREPKSASSRRLVPMPPSLAILLRQEKEHQVEQRNIVGSVIKENDLVFAYPNGSPLDPSTVSHTFAKIARKAGLANIRFHDLRHAHASLMLLTGADPKVISERLGHSSIAITMDIYAHILPGLQEEAAIRFEGALKPRVNIQSLDIAAD